MSEETLRLAREGLEAWRRGDFAAIEEVLAPEAQWRWWEPGEWDCRDRDDILDRLRERYDQGFAAGELEFVDAGPAAVVVVSHPSRIGGPDWPDETATLISFRGGKVVSMQDYRTRDEALAAAR